MARTLRLAALCVILVAAGCDANPDGPSAPDRPEVPRAAPAKSESRPVRAFD